MKKIKIIMPILGASMISAFLPIASLTSCTQTDFNKVSLSGTSSYEKTFDDLTKTTVYHFKQENVKDGLKTKVKATNLKINGLEHSVWANTFTYYVDSAYNIAVAVNIENIIKSMSSTVETITFDLMFINKTANTSHTLENFSINITARPVITDPIVIDEGDIIYNSISSTEIGATSTAILTAPDNKYMPSSIKLCDKNGTELILGKDYTYYLDGNKAYLTVINYQEGLTASGTSTDTNIYFGEASDYYAWSNKLNFADPTNVYLTLSTDSRIGIDFSNFYVAESQATASIYSIGTGTTYECWVNGDIFTYSSGENKFTETPNTAGYIFAFTDKRGGTYPEATYSFFFSLRAA